MLDRHVNNTPLAVIEWEQDYAAGEPPRVFRWSGRAQAIFGWTDRDVLARSADEFGFIYEGDVQRAADAWRDLAEGRCPHNSVSLALLHQAAAGPSLPMVQLCVAPKG